MKKSERKDRGDSSLISVIIVLPIVLGILFTIVDTGIYFINATTINSVARDGARTVAIFGGNGNETQRTALERAYGGTPSCSSEVAGKAGNGSLVECNILSNLVSNPMLTGVKLNKVSCGQKSEAGYTTSIGETTWCEIDWEYSGIPGSVMGFIKKPDGSSPFSKNKTKGTSESEVMLTYDDLTPREG